MSHSAGLDSAWQTGMRQFTWHTECGEGLEFLEEEFFAGFFTDLGKAFVLHNSIGEVVVCKEK